MQPAASSFAGAPPGGVVVPEAFGNAIPTNSKDIMKFIRAQKLNKQSGTSLKGTVVSGTTGNLSKERLKMLDEQREQLEVRLMTKEDYPANPNEKHRLLRVEEYNKMEAEDALSANLTIIFKQYDYDRFKANLLKQVELREAQERAEREARKIAAEERRKAVVERLRLQAEMEERRKREAEEALKRVEEEKARKEQWEANRIAADHYLMPMEDQLSMLVEQDYRELIERQRWQQREREKLLAWEEEQRKKDIIEEEKRKLRMAELEEKKKKLEALRKQQQQKAKAPETDMKEEQDRLNKQLRIQNKAKFISKRGGAAAPSTEETTTTTTASNTNQPIAQPASSAADVSLAPSAESKNEASAVPDGHAATVSSASTESVRAEDEKKKQIDAELNTLRQSYRDELQQVTSVDDLRERIKAFSQEKRGLRLEQRQAMAMPDGTERVQALQMQLLRIDAQYLLVEERIQVLSSAMTADSMKNGQAAVSGGSSSSRQASPRLQSSFHTSATTNGGDSNKPAPLHRGVSAAAMKLQQVQTSGTNSVAASTYSMAAASSAGPAAGVASSGGGIPATSTNDLLRDIDRILREGQRLLEEAPRSSTGMADVSSLLMSLGQVEKKIHASSQSSSILHNVGYSDRLGAMQTKLRALLQHIQENPVQSSPRVSSRVSPRPPTMSSPRTQEGASSASSASNKRPPSGQQRPASSSQRGTIPSSVKTSDHLERKASMPEQEIVERIDQDLNTLNSHTILAQSESAPSILPTTSPRALSITEKSMESKGNEAANESKNSEEDEEEEEDPEKLPGWQECVNSSLFYSAAHHAAYFGYVEVLQFLCKYFDCFIMDERGRTPLFYAALNNQLQCVAQLLGLDPRWIDVGDHSGDTLLHAAAMALNNSSNNSNTAAAENGGTQQPNCDVLEFLLSCEANPDTANHQGMTPSHIAKSVAALAVLAKYKAQLFCMDTRGRLPIWHACFDNRLDCVRYLLSKTPRNYILWPDEAEGDACIHVAAKQGHATCVEVVLAFFFEGNGDTTSTENGNLGPTGDDCLYLTNKRQYTIAHCAANAAVLRVLYEYGMNLFIPDGKEHMPLFLMAFYNRLDCVVYLLDMATSSQSAIQATKSSSQKSTKRGQANLAHADRQGDTALHIACVAGHAGVVQVLLIYLSNESLRNKQGFRPSDLARKANHTQLADLVEYYETILHPPTTGTAVEPANTPAILSPHELLHKLFQTLTTYGTRWTKCYDGQYDAAYYFDHVTNEATWEKPRGLDLLRIDDEDFDTALRLLKRFYQQHNPEKMGQINDILFVYRRRFTELFMTLAQRYALSDLSMFKGVHFHDGQNPTPGPAPAPAGGGAPPGGGPPSKAAGSAPVAKPQ